MLLIAQLGGEGVLRPDGVYRVLQEGGLPGVDLIGRGHPLEGVAAGPAFLEHGEVPLEPGRDLVEQLDQGV